jgi:WD40 repeat protein
MRFLDGHAKEVRGVAFLADGRLVSVGGDKTARLWDPARGTGAVIHKARGPLYAVDASPDGRTVAVSGRHGSPGTPVTLYDATAGRVTGTLSWTVEDTVWRSDAYPPVATREPVARAVWSLSFSADGTRLAAAGRKPGAANIPNGGGGCVWVVGKSGIEDPLPDADAYAVRHSPAGGCLAVTARSRVRFYDGSDGFRELRSYAVQCEWAPMVTFLPSDGRAVIAAGSYVHLVDAAGGGKPVKVKSESRAVTAVAATPDGRRLLVGGKPGRVEVFDVAGPTPVRRAAFDFDLGGVYGLAVAPDGLTFAVGGDRGLMLGDVEGG